MASNIQATIPVTGSGLQSAPIRNNFATAKAEIEALQAADAALEANKVSTGSLAELVQDIMGASIVGGSNVTVTYNDTAGTVTIASSGGGGGGGNATNLTTTLSPTNVIINSDTGTDATIPATDGTNAGVFLPAEKTKLAGIATGATANTNTDSLAEGSTNLYHTVARVLASVLTGLSTATNSVVLATDSILVAIGKLQAQVTARAGLALNNIFTVAQRGAVTTLTDGATITPDFNSSNFYQVTLGGNRTLGNPSNEVAGQSGCIWIIQDATGSRTLSYASDWKFVGGTAPTLSTAPNAVDRLDYIVRANGFVQASLAKDIR